MAPQGIMVIIYMSKLKNTQQSTFDLRLISFFFVLTAPVGISYVVTQFHVSNNDGWMSKGVKISKRCE